MTKQTVVAFNCIRFCFRLYVYIAWDKMLVRFPKICHHLLDFFFLEDMGREGRTDAAKALMDRIESEYQSARAALAGELERISDV